MSFTESLEELVAANENGLLGIHPTWARVRLTEVCSVLNGFAFSSKKFKTQGGVPLIRIRNVIRGWTETYFDGEYDEEYLVEHGELVVGMDGDFNCALWAGRTALLNQRVCKLTPDEQFYDVRLLVHAIKGYLSAINSKTSAITVKHLSSRTVADIPLPLPPKPEQGRLVEALDSYFTRLDDAVASLERVQRNLKRYRASVLKSAVEGRLVPTEAELARADSRDYEPASVLLERILTERRHRWQKAELAKMEAKGKLPKNDKWKAKYKEPASPCTDELRELPPGWTWATIDQLLLSLGQGWSPKCERRQVESGEEWGVIKTTAIQHMAYTETANKLLPSDKEPRPHLAVQTGDILITRAGPRVRVGVCCLVRHTSLKLMICDKVYRLRVNDSNVSPGYLELLLNSPPIMDEIEEFKSGISDSGLNLTQGKFCALAIPLPPRAEQDRIEASVAKSFSVTEVVQTDGESVLLRIKRVRQAVLKWAFEGKLADQSPTDEPASKLLERIRHQRKSETNPTKLKTRRKKKESTT